MKKMILIIILLCLTLTFILGFILSHHFFRKNVSIDFTERVPIENSVNGNTYIKFAIASMVSAEETWKSYKKLINIISEKVDSKIDLIQRRCYKDVRTMLEQDKIDIAFICTGTYVASLDKKSIELLVVPEFVNGIQYQCYIISNNNSKIRDINDLRGMTFAFTDPESNTGCIVPNWIFNEIGISDTSFKKIIFTGSHDRSILAVANNFIDAAAVDALVYHSMLKNDKTLIEKINVIWKSKPFGAPPVVVNKNLDPRKRKLLKEALLNFGQTEEEQKILKDLQIVKFIQPDPESYKSVIKLWKEFEKYSKAE